MSSRQFIIYLLLIYIRCTVLVVYRHCDRYEAFCLLSFGPNITVTNVEEGQKICSVAKRDSRLINSTNDEALEVLSRFLWDYSFPLNTKVILGYDSDDVKKSGDNFSGGVINKLDGVMYYRNESSGARLADDTSYAVVCLTGCREGLEEMNGSRIVGASGWPAAKNPAECRGRCRAESCQAWEWDWNVTTKCWIHGVIKYDVTGNPSGILHKARQIENIEDKCIGNLTEPEINNVTNRSSKVWLVTTSVLLIATISTFIVVACWRKCRKSQEETTNAYSEVRRTEPSPKRPINTGSPGSRVPNGGSHLERKPTAELMHCSVEENEMKGHYKGPMGDVYTHVQIGR